MKTAWHRLLTGQFGYPQPEAGFLYLKSTYDPSQGCPCCGVGLVQRGAFRFKKEPAAKHSQFLGLNWVFDQVFVREPVKQVLEKEGISGIRFSRPLHHKTSEPLQTVFQMHVDTVLPPGADTRELEQERCERPTNEAEICFLTAMGSGMLEGPFCGKIKHHYPQKQPLRIARDALEGAPDMVRTHEWFGSGGSSQRPILISGRIETIIKREGWRGAILNPIELIDA